MAAVHARLHLATSSQTLAHRLGRGALLAALSLSPLLVGLTAPAQVLAQARGEAMLYVLETVDEGGIPVRIVVPVANRQLGDAGMSSRPSKAFEALRARSPREYGATSLRIDSDTKATLVVDKVADADQVLAEAFWTLSSLGFTDISAPTVMQGSLTLDRLAYGAHVPMLPLWDLLKLHAQLGVVGQAFVVVAGQPVPATQVAQRLQKADPAVRKILSDAMAGTATRPKLAILEAISDGAARDAWKLKAEDAAPGLTDTSAPIRSAALDAVIAAGAGTNPKVLAALEAMVENDPDSELKLRAVKALSKAGVNKYADLLESEKLRTGTTEEAREAVAKLAKSSQVKVAGPTLAAALSHSDQQVRDAALQALIDLKQFDLLFTALSADGLAAQMREKIAAVLVDNGSPAAQDAALLYLATKGSPAGAILACQTWGKRGAKTAVPQLIEGLRHDSAEVRAAAAEALALLKDERAITPLADAAEAKARDKETMLKAATDILASLQIDKVKGLVTSKNLTVRQMAIRALAEFAKGSSPRRDVVAILQEARKDPDINIKRSAVFALARLQDDGIARDLAELKKDPDAEIRQQVAISLANASDKYVEAAGGLEEMMADSDVRVKVEAIRGLAKRKAFAAVPKLVAFVRQPAVEVKRAVFDALLQLRTPENAAELRAVFQKGMEIQDSQVRLLCIKALADKTVLADIDALRNASFDPSKEVKLAAIAALLGSKLPESIEVLANFFADTDMDVREKALDAVCAIPAGEFAKTKKNALKDAVDLPDMPEALKKKAQTCQ